MSVEEIKQRLVSLTTTEQAEVSAFLSHLRQVHEADDHRNLDDDLLASATLRQATLDSFYDDHSPE